MNNKHNLQEDTPTRTILRIVGPILIIIGVILIGISIAEFSQSFNNVGMGSGMPKSQFLPFIGIPLLFAGSVMTMFGFMGKVARYQASQVAPVAKDVTNYMVEETKESLHTVASTFSGALRGEVKRFCSHCGDEQKPGDIYCDNCGESLAKTCTKCGANNDTDAKFCSKCGYII